MGSPDRGRLPWDTEEYLVVVLRCIQGFLRREKVYVELDSWKTCAATVRREEFMVKYVNVNDIVNEVVQEKLHRCIPFGLIGAFDNRRFQ